MLTKFLSVCAILICSFSANTQVLITTISKNNEGLWHVHYKSHKPIKSIEFAISPDQSRTKRWQLEKNEQFVFVPAPKGEVVVRRDGAKFTEVSFELTPTYTHLPKYYAPFSPFSDGGLLLHTARFFACADICSGLENAWYLELNVPANEHIYLNGKKYKQHTAWWDKNDGSKIYVGTAESIESAHYISVVDAVLPKKVTQGLNTLMPTMMDKLAATYGQLKDKPMLFASYGETENGRYGRQGGVLPGQVFMHWYGEKKHLTNINDSDLLWFFAHEVAHLFQGDIAGAGKPEDSWLQEGHAEYIAYQLMLADSPTHAAYAQKKLTQSQQACQSKSYPLTVLADKGDYKAHYQCGLAAYYYLAQFMPQDALLADFWQQFKANIALTPSDTKKALLVSSKRFMSEEQAKKLLVLLN